MSDFETFKHLRDAANSIQWEEIKRFSLDENHIEWMLHSDLCFKDLRVVIEDDCRVLYKRNY